MEEWQWAHVPVGKGDGVQINKLSYLILLLWKGIITVNRSSGLFLQPQNAFNKFMDIYFYISGKLEEIISEYIYTPAKVGPGGLGEAYN